MHTPPWQVPVPHSAARLTSSRCWNPLSHTICRSSTVTFEHGHTMPVVGARRQLELRRRPGPTVRT